MIKEEKKKSKYNDDKPMSQIINEYLRTIFISFILGAIITTCLAIHARNKMIQNIYEKQTQASKIDKFVAEQIISNTAIEEDLENKSYAMCMYLANLYETIGDLDNAEFVYRLAITKFKGNPYNAQYHLLKVLMLEDKHDEAEELVSSIKDFNDKELLLFKTKAYMTIGDRYYSLSKFIKALKSYEKAKFYYDKFAKKDKVVDYSITVRIVNSYIKTADILVQNGLNSEAVKYLQKAEKIYPNDFNIKYKLAIIYADLEPVKSIKYFEELMEKRPQDIDISVYNKALLNAANIEDLQGNLIQGKYYRYKIHSLDLFADAKIVFRTDIEPLLKSFVVKKSCFTYKLKMNYKFQNNSNKTINKLFVQFDLRRGDKVLESITQQIVDKENKLYVNGEETKDTIVEFKKHILTKKELSNYMVDVYLYKDKKFKTLVQVLHVPQKTIINE